MYMYIHVSLLCREMGTYMQRRWRDVHVGDFVELECDEVIPADILLLATSDPHYICYIETANIDGETNLKQRTVMPGIVENMIPLVSGELNHVVRVCVHFNYCYILGTALAGLYLSGTYYVVCFS